MLVRPRGSEHIYTLVVRVGVGAALLGPIGQGLGSHKTLTLELLTPRIYGTRARNYIHGCVTHETAKCETRQMPSNTGVRKQLMCL